MPKGEIPTPKGLKKIVTRLRLWKARMKYQKTDLPQQVIPLNNSQEVVLEGCKGFSDLAKNKTELVDCQATVRQKTEPSTD